MFNLQRGQVSLRTRPPVLDVRGLTIIYDTEKGPLHTVRDVSLQIAPGRDLWPGRRVRVGQDDAGAGHCAIICRQMAREWQPVVSIFGRRRIACALPQ